MRYCCNCSWEVNDFDLSCPGCDPVAGRPDDVKGPRGSARKMIVIGSYCSLGEARVNQNKLDSEGILSTISDIDTETGQHPYSPDTHGFTLQVEESAIEKATGILLGTIPAVKNEIKMKIGQKLR